MSAVLTLLAVVSAIWAVYTLIYTIWSVYFGPLSKIPGPKLAAATRFVVIYHHAQGNLEAWILHVHRIYGDVVRTAPDEVSFATGKVWKDIYGHVPGSQVVKCRKDPALYEGQGGAPALINAWDETHIRQRKCFSNAFSEKALREQEPLVLQYVSDLMSNIQKSTEVADQKIDLARQFMYTTFDLMADLAFGEPLGCLAKSEFVSWVSAVLSAMKVYTMVMELNHYPTITGFLKLLVPPSLEAKKQEHLKFSADRVDSCLLKSSTRTNIWKFVLAAEEKNLQLTREEMHSNASLFMIAGTETSATLLCGLLYYLMSNPEMMKTVTEEIRGRFATADEINAREVSNLTYLAASINETFRMHPPVPSGLPRRVPKGGLTLCGYSLPEETTIYIHQFATYRNGNNFSRPDTFLPQRWLPTSDKLNTESKIKEEIDLAEFVNDDRSCLQPFSIGPRNCLGQNLAWLEIRLIIAHLLWKFDLALCEESHGWDEQKVFTLWDTQPLMVIAKPVVR